MDKQTFIDRLNAAGQHAVCLAKDLVFNDLSNNLFYTIQPNSFDMAEHLDDLEKSNLKWRKKEINKVFSLTEIADRLVVENRIPIWINCTIIKSTRKATIVQLLTSRRFRIDRELYFQNEVFPPFHVNIQFPPYIEPNSNERFDINWKNNRIQTFMRIWKARKKITPANIV
jgi:hypothetical protein